MNARRADPRHRENGARQLSLFRAQERRIEHLGGGAKPRHRIEQFIALWTRCWQPCGRKIETQSVAQGAIHEDRFALHLIGHTPLLQRGYDLSGHAWIEPGIQQGCLARPAHAAQHQNRNGNRHQRPDKRTAARVAKTRPNRADIPQGTSPTSTASAASAFLIRDAA